MKKLMAILMALVMCCSLVVSASAESIDTDFFWMDVELDGYWNEYADWEATFESDNGSYLSVYVYDSSEVDDVYDYYMSERDWAEEIYNDDMEGIYFFNEGEIDGCPAFCIDEYDEDLIYSYVLILTDNYVYEIMIEADSMEYDYLWNAVTGIWVYDTYGDSYYEDDYDDDYEDDYDDYEEDDEEVEVEDEDEDDDKGGNKKPAKGDKNDKDEDEDDDKKDKKDKKDKDDEDEDKDDNTTLIIIIVAGVAVVAIAAVVIVLVTKKKK